MPAPGPENSNAPMLLAYGTSTTTATDLTVPPAATLDQRVTKVMAPYT